MSLSKPNIAESRFGVDGANADAANFTAPSSGQRDTGWVLNQIPPSSVATYLQNKTYRWLQFLDEVFKVAGTAVADFKLTGAMAVTGAVTAGSLAVTAGATVGTTLGVTGLLTPSGGIAAHTVTGLLTAAAGVTVSTGQAVTLSGNTTLTVGTGATALGGTLGVTGLVTASGGVTVPTGQAVTLSGTTTLTAGGLITASAGLTAASGQHVTVSNSGDFKHGTLTLQVPVAPPQAPGLATQGLTLATPSLGSSVGIPILVGRRIIAMRAVVKDSATGPTTLVLKLLSATAGSVSGVVATSSASAGSGATQTLTLSGLTTTIASGTVYAADVVSTAGSASCTWFALEVDYDNL